MHSTELECSHLFHYTYESLAPTDLTFCMRCQEYRYPKGYIPPKKPQKPHVDKPSPQKARTALPKDSGLPLKHFAPLPRTGPGGRSLSPENKALALKRTYEMLDEGYTVHEIATAQGFNWGTVNNWSKARG